MTPSQGHGCGSRLTTLRATLQRELLDQEATTAKAKSDYEQAKMERETNDQLAKNGFVAELQYKTSKIKEAELANRNEIEQKRLKFAHESIDPQLASKQAAVDQAKELAKLKLINLKRCMYAPACPVSCNSCLCKSASE